MKISIAINGSFTGQKGLYAYVVPTADSINKIAQLFDELNPNCLHDIHCTVIYSREKTVKNAHELINPDVEYIAKITGLEFWEGHDKAGYLVAHLNSEDLQELHNKWKKLGAMHSFSVYKPHITLLKNIDYDQEFKNKINNYNSFLNNNNIYTILKGEHVEDILGE